MGAVMSATLVDGGDSACVGRESAAAWAEAGPCIGGSFTNKPEDSMKKRLTFRPVLATLCALPLAVYAQDDRPASPTQAAQPARTTSPSSPSVPSSALWQGTPSQAPGVPYPSNLYYPGA